MTRSTRIYVVDAFAQKPFTGNPAAVCLVSGEGARWMQRLATEMNLSETAFLRKTAAGYCLRWFTPSVEVNMCGHATLAAAHVLWEEGLADVGASIRFHTKSGVIVAEKKGRLVEMRFPALPEKKTVAPEKLMRALGVGKALYVGKNRFDYMIEVGSEKALRAMAPNMKLLAEVECRGVCVTCADATGKYDFLSRFFAPASGIDEDPVTGSAHCYLGPFWAKRLGKTELRGYQASKRGGVVGVRVEGKYATLIGRAFTITGGELRAAAYLSQMSAP